MSVTQPESAAFAGWMVVRPITALAGPYLRQPALSARDWGAEERISNPATARGANERNGGTFESTSISLHRGR